MDEQLWFGSCEDVDTYFREGRVYFNETYVKKLAQVSAYFSRVESDVWPMNSGTQQKGFRFGRGFFDPCTPWRKVKSDRCEQNSCDIAPEKIRRPGTSSYFFDLLRKELETDWICVEDLMYRLVPQEEIMQFEASNAIITRAVHEEFSRSTYIGASQHKWGALVNEDNEFCGEADDSFFFVEEKTGDEGGFDICYIRVKCTVDQLSNIAFLSLDMLDDALVDLAEEDEAYRLDLRESGYPVLDMIVPEPKVARRIFNQARLSEGFWNIPADFDPKLSALKLGVNRVIGDYAFSYDGNAPRYNADTVFNATLPTFDENNPDTWPRLVRVPRYVEQPVELGYVYVPNPDYRRADFGVTINFMPNAIKKYINPNNTGYGSVRMEDQDYAGQWNWRRPDWECNRKGKMGFFDAEFRMAMQVKDPLVMHSFLHRLDHGRQATTSPCPVQTYVAPDPIDTYVCQGVGLQTG